MNTFIKDIGHYFIIVLTLVYILPSILTKMDVASTFGIETKLYQFILIFTIYLVVLIGLDKILHRQFNLS